jgi:hypothetical protein
VVCGLWVVVLVLGGVATSTGQQSPSGVGPPEAPPTIDSRTIKELHMVVRSKLRLGDCFDDEALAAIGDDEDSVVTGVVTLVPCDRLHDFEVFRVLTLPGTDFPGRTEVIRRAALGCAEAFKPYVGRAYGPSDLDYWMYYPTVRSWTVLSDHAVTCVVGEPGAKTAGSLHGSHR